MGNEGETGPDPGRAATSLLAPFLDQAARQAYDRWRDVAPGIADQETLQRFFERICRSGFAASFLTYPAARRRVEKLLADVGDEEPAQFRNRPLWGAWRQEVGSLAGLSPLRGGRPVVTLATSLAPPGRAEEAVVYLCLGTEPNRQHYRVMNRATDYLLVLYQERSPLPREATS